MISDTVMLPDVDFARDELPDLLDILDQLRAGGPVCPVNFAGKKIWLINDYATVKQVIASDEYLSAPAANKELLGPTMGNVLATMTGSQHRLNRAVVANVFFPQKMRDLANTLFKREAEELADSFQKLQRVDLVADYTRRYTFNNIANLLGLPQKDVVLLQDWADRIMHSYEDLDSAIAAGREMGEYLLPIVLERRDNPQGDVISLLTQAAVEGEGLSDEEVLAFCRNLFPASIDTSTNSLGSLLYTALKYPDYWGAVASDEYAIDPLIDELLRLESPLVMVPRKCVQPIDIGGYSLKPGDDVRICITGANTDPGQFENPRQFNPGRSQKNFVFGHGEHFCLGSHMARRVLETGIRVLAQRFPNMRLCSDKKVEIVGGVLRGPKQLWVELNESIKIHA